MSAKNCVFTQFIGPSETGDLQTIYERLQNGTFQLNFDNFYLIFQHSPTHYDIMQKEIENLKFVQVINLEFIDSLENNGAMYLLIFYNLCGKISYSKAFVNIATTGKHCQLNTIYITYNLFHRSKLGRDVKLQNTHIVPFDSSRDVMQLSTLSAQIGKRIRASWLVSRRNICSVRSFLEQTIDYVNIQTPDPFPQSFISRTASNSATFWTTNTQKFSTLRVFQSFFHKCKRLFLQSCLKKLIRVLFQCKVTLLKGNLQSKKRHHVAKFQRKIWFPFWKRITWKQKRDVMASEKRVKIHVYNDSSCQ